MTIKLINIGFGNIISANRLISIVSPESAPIKRMIQDARDRGMLIDATYGRRTRAVVIMDSDHFLVQELNREANTIGSKANDHQITKHVVEMKSSIEKIKEQVQNIE
ncbi:DUF1732 domain-containing protein [Bacillus licheniformis]|nr:DUF1732 domain-containing protein [Bacillus licheniformis]